MIHTRARIRPILRHFRKYSTTNNITNNFHQLIANQEFEESIKTKSIAHIYSYVIENHSYLNQESLIAFTYNLLQQNIQAAISIQHILLQNPNYQIPNEIWSIIINKVLLENYYIGAMFIYHELIDNVKFYEELSYGVQDNDQIPFLVDCNTLIALGIIFKNNKDSKRIEGLMRYFRRFYSFLHHLDTYRSLLVLEVETYSLAQDLENSLRSFKNLSYASNTSEKNNPSLLRFENRKFNKFINENIKSNKYKIPEIIESSTEQLDIHQFLLSKICETELYNPIIQRNIYTTYTTKPIRINPILKKSILLKDLPNFENLIYNYIQKEEIFSVNQLITFTKLNHFYLNLFIISSLCKLNKHELAFNYLKNLSNIGKRIITNQSFFIILQSLKDNKEKITLKEDILKFYTQHNNGHINDKISAFR
ncbi:hypothetical protein KGF54_005323 [Candida jiufengensis]|uniref:uncharacterized protein n=1 Tax=Candida jiufengensis TaxID=497108 RepID=UPI0022249F2F|nr:uncharacterized protein KGF54_005323 [Candida jiufengensis]KAI5950175.1 hypothetical protein KGF54_005323 [Candida jiufengensis]